MLLKKNKTRKNIEAEKNKFFGENGMASKKC